MSRIFKIHKIHRMKKAVLDDVTLILLIVFNRGHPSRMFKITKIVRMKRGTSMRGFLS